ncbi:MAG TPA: hypothetical protein VH021_26080 [Trebonia sp.]|nr:hypothetical protein [Trebonia sp.]
MGTGLPAEGFLRHRGLILTAAGGAVVEGGLLTLFAPNARSVAPQVTALPSIAAYHDLRWLFTDTQSQLLFGVLVAAVLVARAALDVAMLRLAWPRGVARPRISRAFVSCAALTLLAWVLLSPAVTLAFGAAVLPFSWPFLAAFPIMLGIVAALSHGGVITAWWRRLPPARAVLWLLGSFATATVAAAVITHLSTGEALLVAALTGLVNARAWYGVAVLAARLQPRPHESLPARMVFSLPYAPIAAVMVLALVVGVARLLFTGTIQLPISPASNAAPAVALAGAGAAAASPSGTQAAPASAAAVAAAAASAVLVVGGWGSSCCDAADGLGAMLPGVPVRQFSYAGLDAQGRPVSSDGSADDLPLPELGDRIAAQVRALHSASGRSVAVVAESEGTLGVYAMLARDRGLPVSSVVLLSPIVSPGQLTYPPGPDGASVSEAALDELNHLVGGMSPYGPSGAQNLLSSVSEFGARYFDDMVSAAGGGDRGKPVRWLAVVPLADAVTLPECGLPPGVIVVPAFHGGLLGDPSVLPMVSAFLSGRSVTAAGDSQMRAAAELIMAAAAAWRMPDTDPACPFPAK